MMKYIVVCISLFLSLGVSAVTTHNFDNPVLQKRYNALIKDIRCPVCQGQSIGGSDAPLAQDLRGVVADMLLDNRSDSEIFMFMTDRYGDFAVFEPPVNYHTYILWFGPFAFIAISIAMLIVRRRKQNTLEDTTPNKEALDTARELLTKD